MLFNRLIGLLSIILTNGMEQHRRACGGNPVLHLPVFSVRPGGKCSTKNKITPVMAVAFYNFAYRECYNFVKSIGVFDIVISCIPLPVYVAAGGDAGSCGMVERFLVNKCIISYISTCCIMLLQTFRANTGSIMQRLPVSGLSTWQHRVWQVVCLP